MTGVAVAGERCAAGEAIFASGEVTSFACVPAGRGCAVDGVGRAAEVFSTIRKIESRM